MLCKATRKDGGPCGATAGPSGYCYPHNPEIPEEEKRAASAKGGRYLSTFLASPLPAIRLDHSPDAVLSLIEDTINQVRAGAIDYRAGNTIASLAGVYIRGLETKTLADKVDELETYVIQRRRTY